MSHFKRYSLFIILGILLSILLWQQRGFLLEQWQKFVIRRDTIIISLTTTPHRIHALGKTIDNIYAQSVIPAKVFINIPYVYKRDNLEYAIPESLAHDARVTILRSNDYGPATKLLGALKLSKVDDEAIIITLDDDVTYPSNLIAHLAYKAHNNPHAVVSITGANMIYDQSGMVSLDTASGMNVITNGETNVAVVRGLTGVAYRKRFFDQDVFDIENSVFACIASDDLYLSFYLAKKGIIRKVVADQFLNKSMIRLDPIGLQADALHKIDQPAKKHRKCVAHMQELDPYVVF